MINYAYETEAEVPEAYKALFVEADGKWVAQVNGAVSKARLDEFRNTNRAQTEKLKAFEGVDLAKYKELLEREEELSEGKIIKKEGMEAAIAARLDKAKAEHAKQMEAATRRAEQSEAMVRKFLVEKAILEPAQKAGVRATAIPDLLARANTVWQMQENGLRAVGADGQEIYGNAGEHLRPEEWIATLAKEAAHLFEPNTGVGARGGSGAPFTGANPWKSNAGKPPNLTDQMKLAKEQPELAARLRAAAAS